MVAPNSGGKFLKSGGGDYVDLVEEFYPVNNDAAEELFLDFQRDLNRYRNDSLEAGVSNRTEEETKFLLEVFLNLRFSDTTALEDRVLVTSYLDLYYDNSGYELISGVGLLAGYEEKAAEIEELIGETSRIDFIDVLGSELIEGGRRFEFRVMSATASSSGRIDEMPTLTQGYCAVDLFGDCTTSPFLYEIIENYLNKLNSLEINNSAYAPGNIIALNDITPTTLDFINPDSCLGSRTIKKIWTLDQTQTSALSTSQSQHYLDAAHGIVNHLIDEINTNNVKLYKVSLFGSSMTSSTFPVCGLYLIQRVHHSIRPFKKTIYPISHTFG